MDLIYTEPYDPLMSIKELGYIRNCSIDVDLGTVASGADNEFEIKLGLYENNIKKGALIYDESGSEIGGIVYGVKVDTSNQTLTLKCKTWRGMLKDHIVKPPKNEDYFVFDGDANEVLEMMINNSYDGFIQAAKSASNIHITGRIRYKDILTTLDDVLSDVGGRIKITFDGERAICEVVPAKDVSDKICLDNDYGIPINAEDSYGYNHIIALGKGELKERQLCELWVKEDGSITDNANDNIPCGLKLRTYIYDYSSVESLEELRKAANKKLREIGAIKKLEISQIELNLEIGDIVGAAERVTGINMKKQVTRKIIKGDIIKGVSFLTTELKVGD